MKDIREDHPANPPVAALIRYHIDELHRAMPPENAFALDADGLAKPDISLWTIWDDDALMGFGALKEQDATQGEVKSMRTAPEHLRKGASRAILAQIVATAKARGYARLNLETGTAEAHAPAVALYRAFGFVDCGPFADYVPSPHNRFMTLVLQETECPPSS